MKIEKTSRNITKIQCLKIFRVIFLFLIFFPLSFGKNLFAQQYEQIAPGIEHAKVIRQKNSANGKPEKVVMNLLRLDLTRTRLDVVHALDAAIGTETTSSMATRHGAIAAINAGFFRLDKSIFAGDAAGVLQIDGKLLSESFSNRIAIGIINKKNKTEVSFGHLNTEISLSMGTDTIYSVSGINRQRKENEIVLFTPEFNQTTLTDSNGTEFTVKKCCSKSPNAGNVKEILEKKGNTVIPKDGYVISANGKNQENLTYFFRKLMNFVHWNKRFNLFANEDKEFFEKAEDITNGVPQLIKNSKIEITWEQEKTNKAFVETRHPRTAVAKLKDGKFLMITVDGRSAESDGISLQDLAEILLEIGATDAMNLDGGGSTTMFLNGKVVNKPSDKEGERKVSDAILVFPRK